MRNLFDLLRSQGAEIDVVHHRFYLNKDRDVLVDEHGEPVRAFDNSPEVLDTSYRPRGYMSGVFGLDEVSPRGGETEVTVTLNGETYTEHVRCSPKDNYNKRLGREIALGRLVKKHSLV